MAGSILDRSDREFIVFIIEKGEKELGSYDHSVVVWMLLAIDLSQS